MSGDDRSELSATDGATRFGYEQLEFVFDALPVLVSYVDADSRYRFVNAAYERWFGRTREEVIGRSVQEVLGPDAYRAALPYIDQVLLGTPVDYQAELPYRFGGTRFVRASYVPHRDATGYVAGYVALVADASAEKRAHAQREELLQRERDAHEHASVLAEASEVLSSSLDYEKTLQRIMDLVLPSLGDFGFFDIAYEDGDVRRIARAHDNPSALKALEKLHFESSQGADKNLCALSSGEPAMHCYVDDAWLRAASTSEEQLSLLQELGFHSMITVPLKYQSRLHGAFTLFFSRSGRRHCERDLHLAAELARRAAVAMKTARLFKEAQEAVAVRDDFLSVAGHELRTPLTALQLQVLSFPNLLRDGAPPEKLLERADKAARNVLRISRLVDDLLDISRISAGRLKLEPTEFDLAETVEDVLARFHDDFMRAECEKSLSMERGLVGTWDKLRIEQIVTNLVTNALKYGKGKPIAINIERRGPAAALSVRDFGIGVPKQDQERIFERFERAVSSRHFGGLGLGLWIARELVEAHGGAIRVESAPGQGALFDVELPLAPRYEDVGRGP